MQLLGCVPWSLIKEIVGLPASVLSILMNGEGEVILEADMHVGVSSTSLRYTASADRAEWREGMI